MLLVAGVAVLAVVVLAGGLALIALFDARFGGLSSSALAQWSAERSERTFTAIDG